MSRRLVALAIAAGSALMLVCCSTVMLLSATVTSPAQGAGCGSATSLDPAAALPAVTDLNQEQVRNAAITVSVGQRMGVPPRGWVIAVATAMQESTLHNLGHLGAANDHDSLGLFQQRPSAGWGSPQQIMDPQYAATKFYEKLLTIAGWETLPLTEAAQRVQRSAYPDAYAKHESLAAHTVDTLTGGAARANGAAPIIGSNLVCAAAGDISASGWTVPVTAPVWSGFRTADRPDHQGVDLGAPRGTVIRAAAAGVVITAECNAVHVDTRQPWGCDRDGDPNLTRGCGWYVNVRHAGNILTRYCHMQSIPAVSPGDEVAAGQQIGVVGSTGHSSGPHLHFEVHLNGDRSSAGAIDPVGWMREHGAALGEP